MILLPTANPALFAHSLALREVSLPSEHLVRGVSKALYFVCDYSRVGEGTGKQKQDLRCNFDLTSLQPFTRTMFSPFFPKIQLLLFFQMSLSHHLPVLSFLPKLLPLGGKQFCFFLWNASYLLNHIPVNSWNLVCVTDHRPDKTIDSFPIELQEWGESSKAWDGQRRMRNGFALCSALLSSA